MTHPQGLRKDGVGAEKLVFADFEDVRLDLDHIMGSGNVFFEVFYVVFGFWWGPLGLWVSDPPLGVKDRVGQH